MRCSNIHDNLIILCLKGTQLIAENYTLDVNKIPRFLPTSHYLIFAKFYLYDNTGIVDVLKTRFEGHIVNLAPIRLKHAFNPEMLG